MNRDLINVDKRRLTTRNVSIDLLGIMKKHIGQEKEITKEELFRKIFLRNPENNIEDWFRWEYVKRAMHFLRLKSNCFIVSRFTNNRYRFFVIKDRLDAEYYINNIEDKIRGMRLLQKRALKAYTEKWHKNNFKIESKKPLKINSS